MFPREQSVRNVLLGHLSSYERTVTLQNYKDDKEINERFGGSMLPKNYEGNKLCLSEM